MATRILITGGCGFIGHHLVEGLLKQTDWEIIVLDGLTYAGNLNRLTDIDIWEKEKHRVKFIWHDLKAPISETTDKIIGNLDYIWHLAAESHVDRSLEDSIPFVMSNVVGTANLLEYVKKYQPNLKKFVTFSTDEVFGPAPFGVDYKEGDVCNPSNPYSASKEGEEAISKSFAFSFGLPIMITRCHDKETKIWTNEGIKNIDEVKKGDLVWTLVNNKELKLQPIQEIFIQNNYEGEMIEIKSNKYNFLVTPDHRMLTKKRYGENNYSIKIAKNLLNLRTTERHYIPLSGEWNGLDAEFIDISKYIRKEKYFNVKEIQTKIKTESLMAFIGWYISEGSYFGNKNGDGTISIGCVKHKEEVKEIIRQLGFEPREYGKNRRDIEFHSVLFVDFLKQFGKGAENKTIPDWVLNYDKKYLKILYKALMEGDGSIQKSYKRYYTKSRKLAEKVAELVIKLGFAAGIKERWTFDPLKNKKSKSYYVNIRKSIGGLEKKNIKKTYYKGKVWCIRTPSGNFFIERNGEIACSGNTMNVIGERQHPEKFVPKVIKAVLENKPITIHGVPGNISSRKWIHARNVCDALLFLMDKGEIIEKKNQNDASHGIYHIVGEEKTALDLANEIAKIIRGKELDNSEIEFVDFHRTRPGHDLRYSLDGSKLLNLGFKYKYSLDESLEKMVKWMIKPENQKWLEI